MEGTFILAKLRTSPRFQAPPRKKAFWRNMVFNTLLYFVETKNIHTSNMTGIFLQGSNRDVGFLGGSEGKESACNRGDCVWSLDGEDPLEKGMATHSSILTGEFHEQRSWQATIHRDAKSQTQLSNCHFTIHNFRLVHTQRQHDLGI